MREADEDNAKEYDDIITDLIEDIKEFYKPEYRAMFETVGVDGRVITESAPCRVVNPGHDMECSWFLLEEGIRRKDEKMICFAREIFDGAFDRGWDEEYGGIFYFKDALGLPVESYEHDMKL